MIPRTLAAALAALVLAAAPLAAQGADSLRRDAEAAHRRSDYPAAADAYIRLASMNGATALDLYNAACSAALAGRAPEALDLLHRALAAGFDAYDLLLERDPDLASLRGLPGWAGVEREAGGRREARERMLASLPNPARVFSEMGLAGYLATYLELEAMEAAHPEAPAQWRGLLGELRGWTRAMVGDVRGALDLEPGAPWRTPLPEDFDRYAPAPAVPAILEAARSTRLVMVNEAHHVPQGRVLTRELLRGLRDQGYRYLAVEALSRDAGEGLAARGHPVMASGTYTREPVFGDLLREAVRLGYTLVPYDTFPVGCRPTAEDPNRCNSLRDSLAAENIVARTFARDPRAKVLVHAGYSHVTEVPRPGGTKWLAYWLAGRGLDPLTVDQTVMRERGVAEAEAAEYRRAEELGWLDGPPVVLRRPDGGAYRSPAEGFGSVDLQVFTPRTRDREGRPDWLFTRAGRRPVPLRATRGADGRTLASLLRPDAGPQLVQAFAAGEGDDAVPVDQVVVRDADPAALALRPGRYRVVVTRADGAERTTLTVR